MLEVFERLLVTMNFREVSVADVCREAEIPRTSFYRRYTNLDALKEALFDQCVTELLVAGGPWLEGKSKRLAPSLEAFYFAFMDHATFWYRVYYEAQRDAPELRLKYDQMMRDWDSAVTARVQESYPWIDAPVEVAQLINAMNEKLLFRAIGSGEALRGEALQELFELAYRGYCSFLQMEMWTEKRLGSPTLETAE